MDYDSVWMEERLVLFCNLLSLPTAQSGVSVWWYSEFNYPLSQNVRYITHLLSSSLLTNCSDKRRVSVRHTFLRRDVGYMCPVLTASFLYCGAICGELRDIRVISCRISSLLQRKPLLSTVYAGFDYTNRTDCISCINLFNFSVL
jgi:hypothetical protein